MTSYSLNFRLASLDLFLGLKILDSYSEISKVISVTTNNAAVSKNSRMLFASF